MKEIQFEQHFATTFRCLTQNMMGSSIPEPPPYFFILLLLFWEYLTVLASHDKVFLMKMHTISKCISIIAIDSMHSTTKF
jgi:hypothetical protein